MNRPAARRLWWLGQQALREVVQLRYGWMLGLTALLMVAGGSVLREFNFGVAEPRFLRDYAGATLAFWGTVTAILLTAALVQDGTERGCLVLALVRGVRRHEWLLSRWFAANVALAWLVLLGQALLGVLLVAHGHGISVAELTVDGGRMLLRLLIVSGFALVACVLARGPLLAGVFGLALTLAAQLASIFDWAGRHAGAASRSLWLVLQWIVPDLALLHEGLDAGAALVYAAGYTALYVFLACVLFSNRE